MNTFIFMVCEENFKCGKCESSCETFGKINDSLQKFNEELLGILREKNMSIFELRKDEQYKKAVEELQKNKFIKKGDAFKEKEQALVDGLLGLWAQK